MKKDSVAVQGNRLIEACYTMTLNEKRLLLLGISKIKDPKKSLSKPIEFSVTQEEWATYFPDANAWRSMRRAADCLLSRYVTFHPKEGVIKKMSWFDSVTYHIKEARVSVEFGTGIQKDLFGVLEQFTKVDLLSVNKLTSLYSVRLYELLSQYLSVGHRSVSVEDFRFAMDSVKSYPRMADLKRNVLLPAIDEINNKTSLIVRFEPLKRGRSITGFKFFFKEDTQQDLFSENQPITKKKIKKKGNSVRESSLYENLTDTSWAN